MKDIILLLYTLEHILAWGLSTLLASLFGLLYVLLSSTKPDTIFHEHRSTFLYLSLFLVNLSVMPLLLLSKNLETKRFFEFAGTVFLCLLSVSMWRLLFAFVTRIYAKN